MATSKEIRNRIGSVQNTKKITRTMELVSTAKAKKAVDKKALPVFKQYRENDGKFYFKFLNAHGDLLMQSHAFDTPKVAGECISELKVGSNTTTRVNIITQFIVAGVDLNDVVAALNELHAAAEEKH